MDHKFASDYIRNMHKMFFLGDLQYLYLDACYDMNDAEEAFLFVEALEKCYLILDTTQKLLTSNLYEKLKNSMDEPATNASWGARSGTADDREDLSEIISAELIKPGNQGDSFDEQNFK